MKSERFDIAIVGSGFAGSLLAMIASRLGYRTALIEKWKHPRFAIGESSTPLANLKLEVLGARYDLPWLRALSEYGSWKREFPEIRCGAKRGFSFFYHGSGDSFRSEPNHSQELLVAANPNEDHADTHWLRADVDHFLVKKAVEAGVSYYEECRIRRITHDHGWKLGGEGRDGEIRIEASFVVDGTGENAVLREVLSEEVASIPVRTRSRSLFSHFEGVALWEDVVRAAGGNVEDYPYPCDRAALHHVFHGGWMWVLRFDHGVTSAGFSLDPEQFAPDRHASPDDEWNAIMTRLPMVARLFAQAVRVRPLVSTGRLQRAVNRAAGPDWAMLPHSACFVDAWLSSGMAHTLYSVERLARMLEARRRNPEWWIEYNERLIGEFRMVDEITSTCFECFDRFGVMTTAAMLYFVAATHCEETLRANPGSDVGFLLADNTTFCNLVRDMCQRARSCAAHHADDFWGYVGATLRPFNRAGLCDPARRNMYPYLSTS